jgi:hypothetical protein
MIGLYGRKNRKKHGLQKNACKKQSENVFVDGR